MHLMVAVIYFKKIHASWTTFGQMAHPILSVKYKINGNLANQRADTYHLNPSIFVNRVIG